MFAIFTALTFLKQEQISLSDLLAGLTQKHTQTYAHKMGYDCGKNGANTTNCHFTIFNSQINTKMWEQGKRDAEKSS